MKLLSNYEEYIVELKLLETLRTFPLFLSSRLRDMLSQIDHEIAKDLLSKHADLDTRVKQTFVDIHISKAEYISFTQPNKAIQVLGLDLEDDEQLNEPDVKKALGITFKDITDDNKVFQVYRGETRWGRFINNVFPNKYILSKGGGQNKEDIESFVNKYKALYNRDEKFNLINVVRGDDIAHWYDCDRYAEYDHGTLGDSCMKNVNSDYFNLYTTNPDIIGMVIMYENERKRTIKARALLWKLKEPEGRIFMDRVYTNDSSDEQVFIDYACKNDWLYKSRQGMGSDIDITDPKTDHTSRLTLMAELNPYDHEMYPYLDTMAFYNPHTGRISNKTRYNAKYELTDTSGGYSYISDYEDEPDYIHSNYHNGDVDKNESKYCVFGDDWVHEDDAIRVWNSSEWGDGENYAVPGHPDVVQSKFVIPGDRTYNKYFPKKKCIWSDYLNTWLFNAGQTTGAKRVWIDLNRSKYVLDHTKRLGKTFVDVDGEYWTKDLTNEFGRLNRTPAPKILRPVGTPPRGWHRMMKFVDDDGNIFERGKYAGKEI